MKNKPNKSHKVPPVLGSLSRSVQYDYGNVSLDDRRIETVENAIRWFGRERYESIKSVFQETYPEFTRLGTPVAFDRHMIWMDMHGVRDFTQCIALALEWGLERYIADWTPNFDQWLETSMNSRSAA